MNRCGLGLSSRENEGASFWRNATGSGRQPWPRAEPPDDGQRAKCSLALCRRFPLERDQSELWMQGHVTRRGVKVLAEAPECLCSGKRRRVWTAH